MAVSSGSFQAARRFKAGLRGWLAGVLLIAVSAFAMPAFADPPGRIGRLGEVQGQVWMVDPQTGEWIAAVRNQPLTTGDRLSTDAGARAEIRVGSSTWRLDGSTEIEMLRVDDEAMRVQVHAGSLAVRARSAESARQTEIVTSQGSFVPQQPGGYRIDQRSNDSYASVWDGSLRFQSNGQSLMLETGQRGDFWLDGQVRYSLAEPERDAFSDWVVQRDRDRSVQYSTAQRYVSPEMTGVEELDNYGSWRQDPQYGALWAPTTVSAGWAPYRDGHWAWVAPWGWTWVDAAPWGFAPSHYGRWVSVSGRWCWSPGTYVTRPVYAPALVAWVGSPGFSLSLSFGNAPTVGWFPLAPREVYVPAYHVSETYVRQVNITHVTNITNITNIVNRPATVIEQTHYAYRGNANALTVVPATVVTRRESVGMANKRIDPGMAQAIARQPVVAAPSVRAPSMSERAPVRTPPPGMQAQRPGMVGGSSANLRDHGDSTPPNRGNANNNNTVPGRTAGAPGMGDRPGVAEPRSGAGEQPNVAARPGAPVARPGQQAPDSEHAQRPSLAVPADSRNAHAAPGMTESQSGRTPRSERDDRTSDRGQQQRTVPGAREPVARDQQMARPPAVQDRGDRAAAPGMREVPSREQQPQPREPAARDAQHARPGQPGDQQMRVPQQRESRQVPQPQNQADMSAGEQRRAQRIADRQAENQRQHQERLQQRQEQQQQLRGGDSPQQRNRVASDN